MTLRLGPAVALVRFGLVTLAVAACGTGSSYLIPSGSSTTLVAGWEHRFTLDWTVESEPGPGSSRRIRGYISSQYGESAEPVRILAQALDSAGTVVGQRIGWVLGGVNGFQRAYFEVAHLPTAAEYRVSVWDYTLLQNPGAGWI